MTDKLLLYKIDYINKILTTATIDTKAIREKIEEEEFKSFLIKKTFKRLVSDIEKKQRKVSRIFNKIKSFHECDIIKLNKQRIFSFFI